MIIQYEIRIESLEHIKIFFVVACAKNAGVEALVRKVDYMRIV